MNKKVKDIAGLLNRFADRFRNAGQIAAERQGRRATLAVLAIDDVEIAQLIRDLLIRRWMANALISIEGGSPGEYEAPGTVLNQQISNAISSLDDHAGDDYTQASGQCATFVADAIRKGGIDIAHIGGAGYAAAMGPVLAAAGFTVIPNNSPLQPGDVAVVQAYPGQNPPYGHAAMWNGEEWVSDYHQGGGPSPNLPYPNNAYRNATPPYIIYRWPGPQN